MDFTRLADKLCEHLTLKISILKNLLGHENIKTTLIYLSLSSAFISSVKSPASDLKL